MLQGQECGKYLGSMARPDPRAVLFLIEKVACPLFLLNIAVGIIYE
jgi:hypothetical protein